MVGRSIRSGGRSRRNQRRFLPVEYIVFASIIKEPRQSDQSCMQSVPIFERRKHPRFPAQGRDILGPSHIVAFVEELHAARCIGMPISRRAHTTSPNPTNQLGVNGAAKRLSTFASQRLCLIALIVEWSVGLSTRYAVPIT